MRSRSVLGLLALAACSSSDSQPADARSAGDAARAVDAGPTPDASRLDAPLADARAGGNVDARPGAAPDAHVGGAPDASASRPDAHPGGAPDAPGGATPDAPGTTTSTANIYFPP